MYSVEPHGMNHADAYSQDDKAQLHERLPQLSKEIAARSGNPDVHLDSFIISTTPYEVLRKKYGDGNWTKEAFAAKHILFQDDDYIPRIIEG